jgi:hypothetical protein
MSKVKVDSGSAPPDDLSAAKCMLPRLPDLLRDDEHSLSRLQVLADCLEDDDRQNF